MTAKEFLEQNGIPDRPIFGRKPKGQMPEYSGSLSELMEEYANQSKCISVEERLPDETGEYLVVRRGIIEIEKFYLNGNGGFFYNYLNITHWQPLPEAP